MGCKAQTTAIAPLWRGFATRPAACRPPKARMRVPRGNRSALPQCRSASRNYKNPLKIRGNSRTIRFVRCSNIFGHRKCSSSLTSSEESVKSSCSVPAVNHGCFTTPGFSSRIAIRLVPVFWPADFCAFFPCVVCLAVSDDGRRASLCAIAIVV